MSRWAALRLIISRSLRQHRVSSVTTALALALAGGLTMAVLVLQTQTYRAFTGGACGFDAVLGARGSALQLVLNAVYHLDTSPGNLPWSVYQAIRRDPRVSSAVPYALGDNYRGFRLVGTTPELPAAIEVGDGQRLQLEAGGRWFNPTAAEAVVGAFAAARTGLRLGSSLHPYHGLVFDEAARHQEVYTVVGVLAPSGTPLDRVIFIPLEGLYRLGGHVLRGAGTEYSPRQGEAIPDAAKEVSAVLLKLRHPQAGFTLSQQINRQGKVATLAWPIGQTMALIFERLGWAQKVLTVVAYLVLVVAATTVLTSLTSALNERRREFAVLRALGASRRLVVAAILGEAGTMAVIGGALSYLVAALIVFAAAQVIRGQTGVVIDVTAPHPAWLCVPPAILAGSLLAGLLPAWEAYRTDVSSHLAPPS